jgi:branched-chain amino acid transport system substrate-binding protein
MLGRKCSILTAILAAVLIFAGQAKAETYKLYVNLPLSGPWSSFGEGMFNSFKLAIDQANTSGDLGSIKLEVVRGDNAGDSAQAAGLATKAGADSKVIGAFCCWSSGLALATHSIYNRYGLPTILGGSNDHRSTRPFHKSAVIFRNSPYDLINMKMLATYATNYAKLNRIFTIDDNTAFSVTQVKEFTKAAIKLHGKDRIIGHESVQLGEKDFTALITKLRAMKPDGVFYAGHMVEAVLFRQQMLKLGLRIPMMSSGGVFSNTYIKTAGEASEGTLASFWGLPMEYYPDGRGVAFEKAYAAAKFQDPYESFGPMAHAAGQVFAQAVKRVSSKGKVTRKAIIKELNKGRYKTTIGEFGFDKNGMLDILHIGIFRVENANWKLLYRTDRAATKFQKISN